MAELDLMERSRASRNALLTTKVARTLKSLACTGRLSHEEKGVLARGSDLLHDIAKGALLVEGGQPEYGISPSHKRLHELGYALSASRILDLMTHDNQEVTSTFLRLRDDLNRLHRDETLEETELDTLIRFFNLLNRQFTEDVLRVPPPPMSKPVNRQAGDMGQGRW